MDNVFLYLRKSRDKTELADPDLLYKHRRELLRLIGTRHPGHQVAAEDIYEEQGSGDLLRTRPACRALLTRLDSLPRAATGELWTTEVSRLTRGNLTDRAVVCEALLRPAVVHCTRDRDYDLRKASDLYYWETETAQARRELGIYKERVEAARLDMMMEARIPTGHPPRGWWWDRNHTNPDGSKGCVRTDPPQFAVVKALCRDALHLSLERLGRRYGLRPEQVHDLLTNPFLCGYPSRRHFPHGGERTRRDNGEPWKSSSHLVPAADWFRPAVPADYEPACTLAEWEAIQQALSERRITRCHTGTVNSWCRELVCFAGHERHARLSAKRPNGVSIPTYELSERGRSSGVYIARERVHAAASAALVAFLSDADRLQRSASAYLAARRDPPPASATAAPRDEVRALERRLDSLLERELDAAERRDSEDLASVQRQRAECKARLATARVQAAALAASQPVDIHIDTLLDWLPRLQFSPADAAAIWEALGDEERRVVALGLLEMILCCAEPVPDRQAWRREVVEVRFKAAWR